MSIRQNAGEEFCPDGTIHQCPDGTLLVVIRGEWVEASYAGDAAA